MASSQFYSVCLARKSIRVCRALLLASPCPVPRSFLHTQTMAIVTPKLLFPHLSFHYRGPLGHGQQCSSGFPCRVYSAMDASSAGGKSAETSRNAREEIRRLDEEIRRLEKQRRSVGKEPNARISGKGGKAGYGGKGGNAGYGDKPKVHRPDSAEKSRYAKSAASGSRRKLGSTAMASYGGEENDDDDDDEDDDDDDDELGEDFSSDADMFMETTDTESELEAEIPSSASLKSGKPTIKTIENPNPDPVEDLNPNLEAPIAADESANVIQTNKHPWKEWNAFFDVLNQKNYFKELPKSESAMEGVGYLRFQSSTDMKHAILEFSRERNDIIRFLTKKHIRTVVNVGCPSTDRKVVNASKRLRVLCEVPEDEVCQQCKLKTFCSRAFAEPSPDLDAETVDVVRVLYSFALNASPIAESQVSYPIGVVKSACHLLDEIVQLSAYPKDPGLPTPKSRLPIKKPVAEEDKIDRQNHRPGDWTCPDCNFLNFSKNRECRECGTFRESSKQLEPGDWECPECTFVNFRRNKECRECLTPRPPGSDSTGSENMMPGDWKCSECQFVNFRKNNDCRRCSARRPKSTEMHGAEELEPGDWKCPECNFRNFKRNKECRECGTLCPDQGRNDERWGLKKSSAGSDRGWGTGKSLESSHTDINGHGNHSKYQEWKPDLNRQMSNDTDDDLEEDADVVLSRDEEEDPPRTFKASDRGSKSRGHVSRHNAAGEGLVSDFDSSDLDDELPKKCRKEQGKRSYAPKRIGRDDNDDEDDDNDMEDEFNDMEDDLSEEERPTSRFASKQAPAKGRGFTRWDSHASDDKDEDNFSDDEDGSRRGKSRGSYNQSHRGDRRGGAFGRSRGRGSFSASSNDGGGYSRGRSGGRGRRGRGEGREERRFEDRSSGRGRGEGRGERKFEDRSSGRGSGSTRGSGQGRGGNGRGRGSSRGGRGR